MGLRLGFAKTTTSDNRAEEFSAGDGNYGDIIAYGFGTRPYDGKPIWATAVEERTTSSSKKKGGFLGIGYTKVTTITYDYYATFAVSFCVGPAKRLVKLWLNDELVYDGENYFDNEDFTAPQQQQKFLFAAQRREQFNLQQDKRVPYRFYKGNETQEPDPTIAAIEGANLTPAYRGLVYMVFDRLNLKQFNDQIPKVRAEIQMESGAQDATVSATPIDEAVSTLDESNFNVDWRRGLIYTSTPDVYTDDNSHGLRVYNLDGALMRTSFFDDGESFEVGVLAMDYDLGDYYSKNGDAFNSAYRINGYTAELIDEKGGSIPYVIGSTSGFVIRSSIGSQDRLVFTTEHNGAALMDHGLGLVGYVNVRSDDAFVDPFEPLQIGTSTVAPAGTDNAQYAYALLFDKESAGHAPNGTVRVVRANSGFAIERFTVFPPMNPFAFGLSEFDTGNPGGGKGYTFTLNFDNANSRIIGFVAGLDIDTAALTYKVFAWSESEGLKWVTTVPFACQTRNAFSRLQGGFYAWHDGTHVCAVDLTTGELDEKFNGVNNEYASLGTATAQVYDDTTSTLYSWGYDGDITAEIIKTRLFLGASGTSTLAAIVRKLANVSGLVEGEDYDVSGIEGISVPGYIADKMIESRKLIEPLIEFFQVTVAEIDHRLIFTTRQTTPIDTINEDQLIAGSPAFKRERAEEKTLPRKYEVRYLDRDQEHRPGIQSAVRPLYPEPTTGSQSTETFELAVSMSATPAKQQTEKLLYSSWIERVGYDFNLPQRFLQYTVGDVVTFVQASGYSSMIMFDQISVGANFQMKMHSIEQSAGQYVSTAIGKGGSTFDMPLTLSVPSEPFFLDIPLLQDADQTATPGISISYWAAGTYSFISDAWPGAEMFRSYDNFSFERKDSTLLPAVWGSTISVMPVVDPHAIDYDSTLDVSVATGIDQLVSVTVEEMLDGKNRAVIIHQDGTSEIISYANVTLLSDTTVRLDTFLRGRRGTDTQLAGAGFSDQIIFLSDGDDQDTANYTYFGSGVAETLAATDNQYYKVVTRGLDPQEVAGVQFTYTCADLKPYAPVNLEAVEIESTGDLTLRWTRRTRIGGGLTDDGVVPLNEEAEAYSIDIYDPTGTTITRTLTSSTPEVLYPVADVTSDYGATPVEIIFAVYQLSAAVGRGFGQKTTVEVNY